MSTQTDVTGACPAWCNVECGEPDEEGRRLHGHLVPGPLQVEVIGHVECGPGDVVVVVNGADHWTGERTRYLGSQLLRIVEPLEGSDEVVGALALADQLLAAAAVAQQAEQTAEAYE